MNLKRFISQNCRSSLLFVVQIFVLLIGALFFAGGCPTDASENKKIAEDAMKKFSGKWMLTYSSDHQDSSFINSSWIELRGDSTFSSNTSFFWREYALNIQPLQGRWWTVYITPNKYNDPSGLQIYLKVESALKVWWLEGNGTRDSTMTWADQNPYTVRYRWKIY